MPSYYPSALPSMKLSKSSNPSMMPTIAFLNWRSVSLSANGNIVAIGARYNDGNGNNDAGHDRIYEYDGNTSVWVQMGEDIDGEAAGDSSGRSV